MGVIILLMGVSGSGKTTVGSLLADTIGWKFYDGDDLHPAPNRDKMHQGIALTDQDRIPWLRRVRQLIDRCVTRRIDAVVACSALKQSYREVLGTDRRDISVIYLKGSPELISHRLAHRVGHFMPARLLPSQFQSLEAPPDAVTIDIGGTPEELVDVIRRELE